MDSLEPRERKVPEQQIDNRDPLHYLEGGIDPTESIGEQAARDAMEELLHSLKPNDALVIRLRYGMLDHPSVAALGISPDDKEPFTLERIAAVLGRSPALAGQLEKRALRHMTADSKRKKLARLFGTDLPESPDWWGIQKLGFKYRKGKRDKDRLSE